MTRSDFIDITPRESEYLRQRFPGMTVSGAVYIDFAQFTSELRFRLTYKSRRGERFVAEGETLGAAATNLDRSMVSVWIEGVTA